MNKLFFKAIILISLLQSTTYALSLSNQNKGTVQDSDDITLFDKSSSNTFEIIPPNQNITSLDKSTLNIRHSETKTADEILNQSYKTEDLLPNNEKISEINAATITDPYNVEVYYVANKNQNSTNNRFLHNNMLSFMGSQWDNGMLVSTPFTHFSRQVSLNTLNINAPPLALAHFDIKDPCSKDLPYKINLNITDIDEKGFNVQGHYQNLICMKTQEKLIPHSQQTFIAKSQFGDNSHT